jgi:hypothetical protein
MNMTTATMVLDRTTPLQVSDEMRVALTAALANIGLHAVGMRGRTLVIRVQNRAALPQTSFRAALREALDAVPGFWDTFESASFN